MRVWMSGAILLCAAACSGQPGPVAVSTQVVTAPTEIVLRPGDGARVDGVLRIDFLDVLQDSRCPIDAYCVWMGMVQVQVGLAAGMGPTVADTLDTFSNQSADFGAYRITMVDVQPPIGRAGVRIPHSAYAIRLRVERLPVPSAGAP